MYSSTGAITKNINELQSDILAERLSNNPYLKYHVLIEKNKQLGTTQQTIIGAINEVLRKANSATSTNRAALAELYNVLGHVGIHPELTKQVLAQAPSLIELVLSLREKLDAIDESRNVSFKEQFVTGDVPQYVFQLTHTPKDETLEVFVNGVQYFNTNTMAFSYEPRDKQVTWLFSEDNNGFNLTNSEVIFKYKYDLKQELEELAKQEEGD